MKLEFSFKSDIRVSVIPYVFLFFTLAIFIFGCSDNSESPPLSPPPSLSISIGCVDGAPEVHIANDGGSMLTDSFCRMSYEDGTPDSFSLQLENGQSIACQLSNMHGGVTVGIDGTSLEESADDCLAPAFQEMLETFAGTVDLPGMIPTPLTTTTVSFCEYTIYLENVTHDAPIVSVLRIDGGMDLQVVYTDITGDIRADTSTPLCMDFAGNMSISSIVYEAQIMFETETDQTVSFSLTHVDMTINNPDIQIDGIMGFLEGWLIDFFGSDFAESLEDEFARGFNDTFEPLLSDIVVTETSCE